MRWGFKLPDRLLFNARAEGIETAKFWKDSFQDRRCIVPADGFFEWVKATKCSKRKYEFTVPGREPFGMAGLWSIWKNPKTEVWEDTFAILTGDANSVMQPIHDRQPIILEPREYKDYLASCERPPLHLLHILASEKMRSNLSENNPLPDQQTGLFDSE